MILGVLSHRRGRWIPKDAVLVAADAIRPRAVGNSVIPGRSIVVDKVNDAFPGWGGCLRCRFPWVLVRSHTTHYDKNDTRLGCFPLCEDCWLELQTPAQRMPYYMSLVDKWEEEQNARHDQVLDLKDYEQDRAGIRAAVESGL